MWYGSEGTYRTGSAGFNPTLPGCTTEALASLLTQKACFDCPTGSGNTPASQTGFYGCEMIAPQFDNQPGDDNSNGRADEKFYIKFPSKKQNDGITEVVPCSTPFHCDIAKANTDPTTKVTEFTTADNTAVRTLCSQFGTNPQKDPAKCAPWHELYGMYMGDGTSKTLEFEVSRMDYSSNNIIGNFLQGTSKFTHTYTMNTAVPYTAFFTGGDRIAECGVGLSEDGTCIGELNYFLNNNGEGRFRLEVEVWLKGDNNKSPIISMLPVLPVPHAAYGVRSKFQIAAYDPDNHALEFRFGNAYEMGGVIRSKSDSYPYSENLALTGAAQASYDATGKLIAGSGVNYGRFDCDATTKSYELTGKCQEDRVPTTIVGVESKSFTNPNVRGLVEWNTYVDGAGAECTSVDGSGCTKMRSGLYSMTVAVKDVGPSGVKAPLDFMLYLYDGPFQFCSKECKDNKQVTPVPTLGVVDNPASDNLPAISYPGIPTFADNNGVYGTVSQIDDGGVLKQMAQACTICGYSGVSDHTKCTPVAADGACGISEGGSIVPNPSGACKINQVPKFVADPTGKVDGIPDTPSLDVYEEHKTLASPATPSIMKYFAEKFDFYVTAIDTDDCTELTLEAVSLPDGATFSKSQVLTDYPEFPQGMKLRRRFEWDWPEGLVRPKEEDPRARVSQACFYAFDKYLITVPFYCVDLKLEAEPPNMEQTLLRFDCKLSLNWQPIVNRFVVIDGDSKYYSRGTFEGFMWHHATVAIDESGNGRLLVDGEQQMLDVEVATDASDPLTLNQGREYGMTFVADQYPNRCPPTLPTTRKMQAVDYMALEDAAGVDLDDGFGTADGTIDPADGTCCTFRMGEGCADDSASTFDGIIDEVAVWNRALSDEEVRATMFEMPKYMAKRELVAPRGHAMDYTAGRVLYARFNNPCMEGPAPIGLPPPTAPTPAISGGRRLQQMESPTSQSRRLGISDHAGHTAGTRGPMAITDADSDVINFAPDSFRVHTKYIYTGVPWEPPQVRKAVMDEYIPIDGGVKAQFFGVGFAKSPFMKCALNLPGGEKVADSKTYVAPGKYYTVGDSAKFQVGSEFHDQVTFTPAKVLQLQDDTAPALVKESGRHPMNAVYYDNVRTDWYVTAADLASPTKGDLRGGEIPPFEEMPEHPGLTSNYYEDFVYGYYEAMECDLPAGVYPSDEYSVAVSNDGGYSGTAAASATYVEYSLMSDIGTAVTVAAPGTGTPASVFSLWFHPDVVPTPAAPAPAPAPEPTPTLPPAGGRKLQQVAGSHTATLMDFSGGMSLTISTLYGSSSWTVSLNDKTEPLFTWTFTGDPQWHHAMVVFDATFGQASLFVNGEDIGVMESAPFPFGKAILAGDYALEQVAKDFVGRIDEVKVLSEASLTYFTALQSGQEQAYYANRLWLNSLMMYGNSETVNAAHASKQLPAPVPNLVTPAGALAGSTSAVPLDFSTYLKFNNEADAGILTCTGCSFGPTEAPWQPTTVKTINGQDPQALQLSMAGGETLVIEGFNFAPSPLTKCTFHATTEQFGDGLTTVETVSGSPKATASSFPIGQMELDRPDGKAFGLGEYSVVQVTPCASIFTPNPGESGPCLAEAAPTNKALSLTSMECVTPPFTGFAGLGTMVAGPTTVTPTKAEVKEVALSCVDGGYATVPSSNLAVLSKIATYGYTVSVWVYPEANQAFEAGKPGATVLAFESGQAAGSVNEALIMYNGERFFYYDDNILDVTSTSPAGAAPNEWHLVTLAVNAEGEGVFGVDGVMEETFTTQLRPSETSVLSFCQDFNDGTPSHFFNGLVDNVQVLGFARVGPDGLPVSPFVASSYTPANFFLPWKSSAESLDQALGFYNPQKPEDGILALSVQFTRTVDLPMTPDTMKVIVLEATSISLVGGAELVQSSGPWFSPGIMSASPAEGSLKGGEAITVKGSNFAPSRYLQSNLGAVTYVNSQEVVVTTDPGTPGKDGGSLRLYYGPSPGSAPFSDEITAVPAPFTFDPSVADLTSDVFAYYNMETNEGDGLITVVDHSGNGNHGTYDYVTSMSVPDRDGVAYSAFQLSTFTTGKKLQLAKPPEDKDVTVCMWFFVDYGVPPPAQGAPFPIGGWKMISAVATSAGTTIYVNTAKATGFEANFWNAGINGFLNTGEISGDGAIDDMWVYTRALSEEEIAARYSTSAFSLNLAGAGTAAVAGGAPPVGATLTIEAWVLPEAIAGKQAILSNADESFVLGIVDGHVEFSTKTGTCVAEPCSDWNEYVSNRAFLPEGKWSHVAVTYDQTNLAAATAFFYVDGVIVDKEVVQAASLINLDALLVGPFSGLVHDLRLSDKVFPPWHLKGATQCPLRAEVTGSGYFSLDQGMGAGVHLSPPGGLSLTGLSPSMWTNSSYDDPTLALSTTLQGPGLTSAMSGTIGEFTITARSHCGKKRLFGGDAFSVSMISETGQSAAASDISITDTGDGNYHVQYQGLTCGRYTTTVALDNDFLPSFTTDITVGPTSGKDSYFEGTGLEPGCFGTWSKFVLQAVDAFGCKQTGTGDNFQVVLVGPQPETATVTPLGGGRYEVAVVPTVPGDYVLQVYLDGELASEHCVNVCRGYSASFSGSDYAEFPDAGNTPADVSNDQISFMAWVLPEAVVEATPAPVTAGRRRLAQTGSTPYILYKGSAAEAVDGSYIKGYSLSVDETYSTVTAAVYAGLGEIRTVSVPVTNFLNNWSHVAASYDGTTLTVEVNTLDTATGAFSSAAQSQTFGTLKLNNANYYQHPLTVGHGFVGRVDEVTVVRNALTSADVQGQAFCSPGRIASHLAFYAGFNEKPPTAAAGEPTLYAVTPAGMLPSAAFSGSLVASSPLYEATNAFMGHPSASASYTSTSAVSFLPTEMAYTLTAKDQCGAAFTDVAAPGSTTDPFQGLVTAYINEYFSPDKPANPQYPRVLRGNQWLLPLATEPVSPKCTVTTGVYSGKDEEATSAGHYYIGAKLAPPLPLAGLAFEQAADEDLLTGEVAVSVEPGTPAEILFSSELPPQSTVAAGVSGSYVVAYINDAYGNIVKASQPITVSLAPSSEFPTGVSFEDGYYIVDFETTAVGASSITLAYNGLTATYNFASAQDVPRELLTDKPGSPGSPGRFEHSMAYHGGDLYVFGGAAYDKSYMNDVHVLKNADGLSDRTTFGFKKALTLTSTGPVLKDVVVEAVVNTKELIDAGKLLPNCEDMMFTEGGSGEALLHYVDKATFLGPGPGPVPGCGSPSTVVFIQIPGGAIDAAGTYSIDMFYGNSAVKSNAYHTSAIFDFYEGFESPGLGSFTFVEPCTLDPAAPTSTFAQSSELAVAGQGSLYAAPGTGVIAAPVAAPLSTFKLKAYFWDSDAEDSAHYISPDFGGCGTTASGDTLFPGTSATSGSTAVGTYTLSHKNMYCTSSPWKCKTVERNAQWHSFEVVGTAAATTVLIDGTVVKSGPATTLDKVLISAGLGVDNTPHPKLSLAHAFWDEISVMAHDEGLTVTVGAGPDAPVAKTTDAREWMAVPVAGTPPPPRYGHSTVVEGDSMYVFGGERSSYSFNDVWAFNFVTGSWSFVATKGAPPSPRFDHSAVTTVLDGHPRMIILGGRDQAGIKADMWALDLTKFEWTKLADTTGAGTLFGHGAAADAAGKIYVYGGYTGGGYSAKFYECTASEGAASCISPCEGKPTAEMAGLTPRYSHGMVATKTGVYVVGGSGGSTLGDVYKFTMASCTWAKVDVGPAGISGYSAATAAVPGGFAVHGGLGGAKGPTTFLSIE